MSAAEELLRMDSPIRDDGNDGDHGEDGAWAMNAKEREGGNERASERNASDGGGGRGRESGGRGGRGGGRWGNGGRGGGRGSGPREERRDDRERGGADRWGPPRDDRRAPPPPSGGWDRRDDRRGDRWGPPPPREDRRDDRWGPPPPRDDPRGDRWGPPPPREYYDSWGRGAPRDDYDSRGGYYDDRYARGPPREYYDDRGREPPRDRGYYPPRSPPRGPPREYYDDRGPPRRDSYDSRGPPRDDRREEPYVMDTKGNNGLIVGPKGETIKRIEHESGAYVKCLTDKTTVEITGHPDAVQRARDMIIARLERQPKRREEGSRDDGRSSILDRLSGKRQRDDHGSGGGDKRARSESLLDYLRSQAKEAGVFKEFPAEYVDDSNMDERGNVEQSVSIANYVGLIIGREGRMHTDIQQRIGIPMQINKEDEIAVFKGPPESVGQGLALVREVIETTNAVKEWRDAQAQAARAHDVEATVEIAGFVGAIIGKGGARISQIKREVRCFFEVDREKEVVNVRGPAEKVERAKQLISETIEYVSQRNQQQDDTAMPEAGEVDAEGNANA